MLSPSPFSLPLSLSLYLSIYFSLSLPTVLINEPPYFVLVRRNRIPGDGRANINNDMLKFARRVLPSISSWISPQFYPAVNRMIDLSFCQTQRVPMIQLEKTRLRQRGRIDFNGDGYSRSSSRSNPQTGFLFLRSSSSSSSSSSSARLRAVFRRRTRNVDEQTIRYYRLE